MVITYSTNKKIYNIHDPLFHEYAVGVLVGLGVILLSRTAAVLSAADGATAAFWAAMVALQCQCDVVGTLVSHLCHCAPFVCCRRLY